MSSIWPSGLKGQPDRCAACEKLIPEGMTT